MENIQSPPSKVRKNMADQLLVVGHAVILMDGCSEQLLAVPQNDTTEGKVGYPESLTDPSYKSQRLVLTPTLVSTGRGAIKETWAGSLNFSRVS